ncbi:MAG: hypothetical protein ABSH36_13520, partial [Solirubrobacteraceae bacterium]
AGSLPPGKQGIAFGAATANGAALQNNMTQALAALRNGTAAAGTLPTRQKAGGPLATPAMMLLDMLGQMQSLQPIEPGLVAHDLWTPEFVE